MHGIEQEMQPYVRHHYIIKLSNMMYDNVSIIYYVQQHMSYNDTYFPLRWDVSHARKRCSSTNIIYNE